MTEWKYVGTDSALYDLAAQPARGSKDGANVQFELRNNMTTETWFG